MSERLRSLIDLRWTDSGDLMLDPRDKDLKDTRHENLQSALQHIEARLQSTRGDWKGSPATGANLMRFAGRPNTAALGAEIEDAVLNELTRGGLFSPSEVVVQVFPVDRSTIGIFVRLNPVGTRGAIQLVLDYSLQDTKISVRK